MSYGYSNHSVSQNGRDIGPKCSLGEEKSHKESTTYAKRSGPSMGITYALSHHLSPLRKEQPVLVFVAQRSRYKSCSEGGKHEVSAQGREKSLVRVIVGLRSDFVENFGDTYNPAAGFELILAL